MLKNYFKIAIRQLLRQKFYSSLNISGLAIGIAACILILLFVQHEINYDRFNRKADQIYRLAFDSDEQGQVTHWAYSFSNWAPLLKAEFPEVVSSVRLAGNIGGQGNLVEFNKQVFTGERCFFADSSIFEVFTLPLIHGNPGRALVAPHSVVISEKAAQKYFGEVDPLGKVLKID